MCIVVDRRLSWVCRFGYVREAQIVVLRGGGRARRALGAGRGPDLPACVPRDLARPGARGGPRSSVRSGCRSGCELRAMVRNVRTQVLALQPLEAKCLPRFLRS